MRDTAKAVIDAWYDYPVKQQADNQYRCQKMITLNGQKRRYSAKAKSKRTAQKLVHEQIVKDIADADNARTGRSTRTIQSAYNDWIDQCSAQWERTTLDQGIKPLFDNHILPALGGILLTDLDLPTIQSWANGLPNTQAKRTGRQLSMRTVRTIVARFKQFMAWCVAVGYIDSNPCNLLVTPKRQDQDPAVEHMHRMQQDEDYLTVAEARQFIAEMATGAYPDANLILLMLYTGLRPGEARGLAWSAIDYKAGTISVYQTLTNPGHGGVPTLKRPKNATSARDIPLTEPAKALLQAQKDQQAEWRKQALRDYHLIWTPPMDLIFCRFGDANSIKPDGKMVGVPIREQVVNRQIVRACRRCDFRYSDGSLKALHGHAMRHTFTTLMADLGVPLSTVAAMLGHADVSTTQRYYRLGHAAAMQAERETVDSYLASLSGAVSGAVGTDDSRGKSMGNDA